MTTTNNAPPAAPATFHEVRVLETWAPTPSTRAIRVEKPAGFVATVSQATRLVLREDLFHAMSMASGPDKPYLDFAVEMTASEFKRVFAALSPGDVVTVKSPPGGRFFLDRDKPAVMIAHGIGITPIRALLEALSDEQRTLTGVVVHTTRSADDVPFRADVDAHAARAGLRLERPIGPLDAAALERLYAGAAPDAVWYVCGSVEDVRHVHGFLEAKGVHADRLRLEAFRYPGSCAA
jgi:ferredoxin-NADP reductase